MNPTDEREQEEDGKNMGVVSKKEKRKTSFSLGRIFGAISPYRGISRDTVARERLSTAIAREFIHQTVDGKWKRIVDGEVDEIYCLLREVH